MKRKSKKEWLEEGFRILAEFNQDKLRIQYLCERMGVTRGSFYHHFEGINGYVEALMEAWKEENTLAFIDKANTSMDPKEKMELLNGQVVQTNQAVESGIRSWSFYHPIVAKAIKEVDHIRINYIRQLFLDMGLGEELAGYYAQMEYALLVGVQILFPNIQEEEMKKMYRAYKGEKEGSN